MISDLHGHIPIGNSTLRKIIQRHSAIAVCAVFFTFICSLFFQYDPFRGPYWTLIVGALIWLLAFGMYCSVLIIKIREKKHSVGKSIFAVLIYILTGLMIPIAWNSPFLRGCMSGGINHIYKQFIFHKVNNQELLSTCRMMIRDRINYKSNRPDVKSRPDVTTIFFEVPGASDQVPEIINKLKPSYISITDNGMMIVLYSGLGRLALHVYPEGVKGRGDKMLTEGLWMIER